MGQDFRALMEHHLSIDELQSLPTSLNLLFSQLKTDTDILNIEYLSRAEETPAVESYLVKLKNWLLPTKGKIQTVREELNWRWRGFENLQADKISFAEYLTQTWKEHGYVELYCNPAMWIMICPTVMQLGCWVRWFEFLSQPKTQDALKHITFEIANSVNAKEVIFAPDSASVAGGIATNEMLKGRNYNEIKESITNQAGPSECSLQAILETFKSNEASGYYIEASSNSR